MPFPLGDPAAFERLYALNPDPWRFDSSPYERAKYAATVDALPDRRFSRALEVGCSIGVLTRMLAASCDELLAVDVSPTALALAETRCEDLPWVQFAPMTVPAEWPEGPLDLILFSEVLYYLEPAQIRMAAARALRSLSPHGAIVLVNWLGPNGAACSGEEAAALFIAECRPRLAPSRQSRTADYRLDVLT